MAYNERLNQLVSVEKEGDIVVWDFATRQDKAMILRGSTDYLMINLNGAAIPSGGVFDFEIETEEDNS